MSTALTGKNSMNSSDREDDDLTVIKGIGPARQRWLRESLNVRTFQDLAKLSVDEIESQLKATGQIADRSQINQWIVAAQELAVAAESSQQVAEPADAEAGGESGAPAEEGEWEWLGAFIVEFRVRKVEDQVKERQITVEQRKIDKGGTWLEDDKEKNSIVIEGEQLYQWMLEQVGEKAWQETEAERLPQALSAEIALAEASPTKTPPVEVPPVEAPPTKAPPVEAPVETGPPEAPATEAVPAVVEATHISTFQPPDVKTPTGIGQTQQPFTGFIRGGEPFALEVAFELPALAVADMVSRQTTFTYSAQFHARNLATGASMPLGNTKPDAPVAGQLSYTAKLSEVSLPPGMYRLGALVIFQSRPPSAGYLEVPLLQVV